MPCELSKVGECLSPLATAPISAKLDRSHAKIGKGISFAMFCVVYRWKVEPNDVSEFVQIWSRLTKIISDESPGLGSRLHREDESTVLAYAQWPDRHSWETTYVETEEAQELRSRMRRLSHKLGPPLELDVLSDLLLPVPKRDI